MPHVLVAGRIHQAGIDVLRAASGITFDLVDEVSTASYAPKMPEADALLIRTQPLPASVIETAPRLRVVSRHGVGYDSVDAAALTARRIPLAVVGDVNSRSVAEHAFALLLALAKRVTAHDKATREGNWAIRNTFSARELGGRSLLLIGYGRIGRLVGDMARAFDMRVMVFDPFQAADAVRATGVEPVDSLAEGLASADVVSLHIPKNDSKAVIGAEELARMRPHSLLVNTGRGGLVDEEAVADALDAGHLAGAGLDVFVEEPPAGHERLLRNDRAILSPHIAGLTEECTMRMSEAAARNIVDYFDGRLDPSLVVNLPWP